MSTWSFEVAGTPNVDAKINAGRIDVLTIDQGPVEVTTNDADKLEVSQAGQTILIHQPRGFFSGRVRVTVRVPRRSNIEISMGAADVTIEDGCEEVSISGASGDVRVGAVGRIRIKSASGDIRLATVGGDATLSTASGDVSIDHVEGDLDVSLASGDIRVRELNGNASVSTASGNVRIDRCSGSTIEVRSISGDLMLGLPTGVRVDADLNSLNGRIKLPDRDPNAPPATRNVRLSAKTTTGDITVRRA